MFGLHERRKEKVEGFSRGMKRCVCIAMALMNRSSVLFLDEPTSSLDVECPHNPGPNQEAKPAKTDGSARSGQDAISKMCPSH